MKEKINFNTVGTTREGFVIENKFSLEHLKTRTKRFDGTRQIALLPDEWWQR